MDRTKIKKYLKRGDITLIASKAGVSQSMVSQFLAGEKESDKVFNEAIALAEQRKKELFEKEQRINAL